MWYPICWSVTCSLAWSHLRSEDTDAIHPHQCNQQSFTRYIPPATLQLHLAAACCCRWRPSAFCPSLSPPSRHLLSNPQTLTPPILTAFVPVLPPKVEGAILWLLRIKRRFRSIATPAPALVVFFILWQLEATTVTSKAAWHWLFFLHGRAKSGGLAERERKK